MTLLLLEAQFPPTSLISLIPNPQITNSQIPYNALINHHPSTLIIRGKGLQSCHILKQSVIIVYCLQTIRRLFITS